MICWNLQQCPWIQLIQLQHLPELHVPAIAEKNMKTCDTDNNMPKQVDNDRLPKDQQITWRTL